MEPFPYHRSQFPSQTRAIDTLQSAICNSHGLAMLFNGSSQRAIIFGTFLSVVAALFRKRLIVRVFGGSLDHWYENASGIKKRMTRSLVKRNMVLVETKSIVQYFKRSLPSGYVRWFPNSRPIGSLTSSDRRDHETPGVRFVFLGLIQEPKGVRELTRAAAQFAPGTASVDFYGDSLDDDIVSGINQGASSFYRGKVNPEDVPRILERYDVLILPTYYPGEGYPGVILEAFSAGLAVIATDWRSIPELIEHEQNGLLVKPQSVEALKDAMRRLVMDKSLLIRLKAESKRSAVQFDSKYWNGVYLQHLVASAVLKSKL
jgi:glycosyltransferase involved in cell wall biosynthesis